jgi:hypothetical protein
MLNGSIGTYAEQVLIATGRSDWKSRINEDEDALFLRQMEGLLRRGGKYSDVRQNLRWRRGVFLDKAGNCHDFYYRVLICFVAVSQCSPHKFILSAYRDIFQKHE